MRPQTCLTNVVVILIFFNKTEGCLHINTSCNHINTAGGFRFTHRCPEGSEIILTHNMTPIAHAVLGTQKRRYSNDVMSLDNHSVVTRDCKDLQVKCLVPNGQFRGESSVKEICEVHKITEELKYGDPPNPPSIITGAVVSISLGVILLIIGIIVYMSWIKKLHLVPPVSVILGYLQTFSRHPEVQEVNTTQHNGDISIDLENPHSSCLDRDWSNGEILLTDDGDISLADVNRASNHRVVNGLRDDPGGVHDNKGKGFVGNSGQTPGGHPPEGHDPKDNSPEGHGREDLRPEGQRLLSDQRAASQGFDMTGGAVALAYEHGFDPDPVSRCSAAPDTDVESTSNMRNP